MKTTILHDLNNLAVRCVFVGEISQKDPNTKKIINTDWDLWKYFIFDSCYRSVNHVKNASEIVLAVDAPNTWRKEVWPRYKESRKKKRVDSGLDWEQFYVKYDELIAEFTEYLPFKVIKINRAEADDTIGVIAGRIQNNVQVISTDKDYLQLSCDRVNIFNPMQKKNVKHPNPAMFLVEQCLLGQPKDDIFNIKTPLDHPVDQRKKPFGPKALEKVLVYGWKKWLTDNNLMDRFKFNLKLMDFKCIPEDIQDDIMGAYSNYKFNSPDKIYQYFKLQGWPEYLDNITQVEKILYELY